MTLTLSRFVALFLLLLGLCALARPTAAAITVTSTVDGVGICPGANCTLRAAIAAAMPGETITFSALFNAPQAITLTSELQLFNQTLTIQGPGAHLLTISGNHTVRVFNIVGGDVTLSGLTIANGSGGENNLAQGGGIYHFTGLLTVTNCTLRNNSASVSGSNTLKNALGGGIYNYAGTVNVINSTLAHNSASATGATGANSINFVLGGGIYNYQGTVNVINSTLSHNSASAFGEADGNEARGGGIYNDTSEVNRVTTCNVINSTLTNNSVSASGGTLGNAATGGGIYNQGGDPKGIVNVTNSTLANNSASATGNNSQSRGGGMYNFGTGKVKSTIVALNSVTGSSTFGPDVIGDFQSLGFNLIGNPVDSTGFGIMGDLLNQNPQLGALADNGGPTQTLALLANSPAIDKGISNGLTTDQRGFARTVDFPALNNATGGDGTDIGAYEFGTAASSFHVQAADPAVCLDPNGLVGVTATLTNGNAGTVNANFTATLPAGLTALAGTCAADVNPGGCAIAGNGGSVTWNGQLNGGQTVTIIYRARLAANVGQGAQLTIQNQATVGGIPLNFNAVLTVNCPNITNTRVSDQKPGSLLVFPYYTSTIGGASDTRMTISNISNAASTAANQAYVHLFFIDGTTCQQADVFVCLTPGASIAFKASEYDPGNTGYLLAVAVDKNGVPVQNNVLIGNAFVRTPTLSDNYGAESFAANSFAVAAVTGNTATLFFDQVGYDAVPKQFAVEVQSPLDAVGQQVVTAGLSGDLNAVQITGAAQVGTAQAFNEKEQFASFQNWLTGTCQARGTIATNSPRVPNGLGNLIKTGQSGHLKFNVGAAVGVLLTPRGGAWTGIRTLHKTQTTTTSLTIPIFVPVC